LRPAKQTAPWRHPIFEQTPVTTMIAFAAAIRWALRTVLLAVLLLAAGFVVFAVSIKSDRIEANGMADGIVALTGGHARIDEAVRLLSSGKAKRMLITGVNPATTSEQLSRLVPSGGELFKCCIDLGREAEDTIGNAIETRDWTELHGFKSLIVVTSSYHMPRTLLELRRVLPTVEITPHAVEPNSLRSPRWWADRHVLRLMAIEYVKYLSALARQLASRVGVPMEAGRAFFAAVLG
jgi:uncharacterized SAM-binding protein YcdF (DUF218 family)